MCANQYKMSMTDKIRSTKLRKLRMLVSNSDYYCNYYVVYIIQSYIQ